MGEGARQVPLSDLTGGRKLKSRENCKSACNNMHIPLIIQSSCWYSPRAYASGGWRRGEGG